uniref:Ig-like domain-containing protein n=1 Tax=Pundamilia nyererei TaxID=303518 RepID=A0A3B4GKR2_9CICH
PVALDSLSCLICLIIQPLKELITCFCLPVFPPDDPKPPSVSVSPSGEITEGTAVTLTCSSDANPAATYVWYKRNSQPLSKNPQLIFSSIQSSDSEEYYCRAVNKLGSKLKSITIDVKFDLVRNSNCSYLSVFSPPDAPKPPSVSVSPSGEIKEGTSVTLTCSSDANTAATYVWYKMNNQTPVSTDSQLSFSSIQPADSGEYYCTAENRLGTSTPIINVLHGPLSMSVSPSGEIVEGSSVNLTCSSDANPAANYTWYKTNNQTPLIKEPQLIFSSIQPEHSGSYYCVAQNTRGHHYSTLQLTVVSNAPKLPSVSVTPSGEIAEGSSVTLTCSSDANPAANYTWYKENKALPLGPEGSHHFPSISSEDRGNYFCKSENQYGQINSSYVFINVQCKYSSLSKGFSILLTLTCSSDANPAANYTWYKEKEDSPKAHGQTFTIDKFSPAHSGAYQCKVQNNRGHHRHQNSILQRVSHPLITAVCSSACCRFVCVNLPVGVILPL